MRNFKIYFSSILLVAQVLFLANTSLAQGKTSPSPTPSPGPTPPLTPDTDDDDSQVMSGGGISPPPARMGQPQPRQRLDNTSSEGPAAFQGEASPSCPFQGPSPSVMDLVGRVQSGLRTLKNEAANCNEAVRTAVEAAEAQINSLMRQQREGSFSINTAEISCTNYEPRLRRQFDVAVAEHNSNLPRVGNSTAQYSACYTANDFNECAEGVYVQLLSARVDQCSSQAQNVDNQAIRSSIEQLTNLTDDIIQNSGTSCQGNTANGIVQTAIAQATSTASMAAGFGLVGLGVSMAGRLLSSLANRLLNDNSAERYLNGIAEDIANPSRFCLFYDVQRAALGCENDIYQNALSVVPTNPDLCQDTRNALAQLTNFSTAVEGRIDSDRLIQSLSRPVGSTGKKYIDLLRDTSRFLQSESRNNPFGRHAQYASELERAIRIYDDIASNPISNFDAAVIQRRSEQQAELASILTGGRGTATTAASGDDSSPAVARNLNLSEALTWYLQSPGNGGGSGNVAGLLNNSTSLAEALRRADDDTRAAREGLRSSMRNGADNQMLDRLLSAATNTMSRPLERRLQQLYDTYSQNAGQQADARREMDWLDEMLSICMSTQGAAHFGRDPRVARLDLRSEPSEPYRRICSAFNCPDGSLFVPFEQFTGNTTGASTEDRFKNYQCASDRRLSGASVTMRNRLGRIADANRNLSTAQIDQNATTLQGNLRERGSRGVDALRGRICGSN